MQTKDFLELVEAAGYDAREYSGRVMYGKYCAGVEVEGERDQFRLIAAIMQCANDADYDKHLMRDLYDLISDTHVDSMGMGLILYWPGLAWSDDLCDDDQDTED